MFTEAKALLRLWSDYQPAASDLEAFLNAYLDESPVTEPVRLDLGGIHKHGLSSTWASRYLTAKLLSLQSWCVAHGRYFHNVAVKQGIDEDEANLIHTPELVAKRWWWGRTSDTSKHDRSGGRTFGDLKPWFARGSLNVDDLVVVDAPVFASESEATSTDFFLSDYPDFLRDPSDPFIPLQVSTEVSNQLRKVLDDRGHAYPFCRVLGLVTRCVRGEGIRVLQICIRFPAFSSLDRETFAELVKEAYDKQFQTWKENDRIPQDLRTLLELRASFARRKYPELDPFTVIKAYGPDIAHELPVGESDFGYSYVAEREINPYTRVNGFWTALSMILPAWKGRFPLAAGEVKELLRNFDAAYNKDWEQVAHLLAFSGVMRYTPKVIAQIRSRIAGLEILH